nr:AT-rich interactive domain-containing protein 4A isoform X1 [Zootoca vivipara]XP_034959834.1 AT-rich interactive domain-containing protein 4A isoform X1 [Zootoca vivipara]
MKAADEPAYLTVGTDVSAKYRGAFCEAKIKTVKRLVKVKVTLKQDNSTQLVQDDQVKGPLRVGATVETKMSDGSFQEATVSKLTDASWYTVVFDDGDERTLRRTSLCLKGERHFAESETLDQLPLTNPEHFGTPVIGKKSNRGRRSSLPVNEDEKEEESSEEDDDDKRRLNDELLGKVVSVASCSEEAEWYPALVLSPSCSDDIAVKKDQCLVRSFSDSKFYSVARKDIEELDILNVTKSELSSRKGLQEASVFFSLKVIPSNWKMDMREILESSSSDEEDGGEPGSDEEEDKREHKEEEVVPEEELDPEERDNFLQQLYKFMEDRGTPINKPPVLGYKDLNLFKLFRLVYQQGGCDNIDSGAVWKQIYMDLGIPILNSAASYNVKTAYRKYLYGFEEYCRSANIQFRTIHHNEPKIIEAVQKPEEPMEESVKEEPEMFPIEVEEDENDCSSESEKEEIEQRSPRGRRRLVRDVAVAKKEGEDDKMQDKLRDSNKENKDVEDMSSNAEKRENELSPGSRKTTPKQKEKKARKEEESDKESDEEEDRREELENRGESEGEEGDEDAEPCLTGTKVKVKYGRGKTQKIYEASIKSTENDDGEVLYLVHYYGWNVRYDEWVKADRIIWPVEKGGSKKKQKKKAKSKEESEKDEKREEEKQKVKRGRPPLKSTLLSNLSCGLPKTPNSESKPGARNSRGSLPDCSPLPNGTEGLSRRQTRRSSGMLDSDRGSNDSISSDSDADEASEKNMNEEFSPANSDPEKDEKRTVEKPDEEIPKISLVLKENDRNQIHPLEPLKLKVEENEQVVQIFGNKSDQVEDIKREVEKSPRAKGRRNRTRDSSLENVKSTPLNQEEAASEHLSDSERLDTSSSDSKGLSTPSENETDPCAKDKKLSKRKTAEQPSPDKRVRLVGEMEVPNIVSEGRTNECSGTEECKDFGADDSLRNENEEMPSLVAESDQRLQGRGGEHFSCSEENRNPALKDEDDSMPQIGPETLLCHEVDLDDVDEKDKIGPEKLIAEKPDSSHPTSSPPALPPVVQPNFSVASPLTLSQDESRSIKSESDITIEVDSVAEESQEGLCESESANGFEAFTTTSSNCSIAIPDREIGERGQKRPSDNSSSSLAKKQKRTPKRASTVAKNEKNGTGQSSDSEDLPALDSSSKCTPVKHIGLSKPQKLTRSPARVLSPNIKDGDKDKQRDKNHQNISPRVYKWSVQLNELDNMSSAERISFLQEKLQEIRKYYMSLKSEVATIDRRRKRLKKKDREGKFSLCQTYKLLVSHTGASMSSASSDTGMSPSSSSPPQNVLAVECR